RAGGGGGGAAGGGRRAAGGGRRAAGGGRDRRVATPHTGNAVPKPLTWAAGPCAAGPGAPERGRRRGDGHMI
ncbi:hypothetical protein ABT075_37045, partial [Streptomyces sp. NPDC002677]